MSCGNEPAKKQFWTSLHWTSVFFSWLSDYFPLSVCIRSLHASLIALLLNLSCCLLVWLLQEVKSWIMSAIKVPRRATVPWTGLNTFAGDATGVFSRWFPCQQLQRRFKIMILLNYYLAESVCNNPRRNWPLDALATGAKLPCRSMGMASMDGLYILLYWQLVPDRIFFYRLCWNLTKISLKKTISLVQSLLWKWNYIDVLSRFQQKSPNMTFKSVISPKWLI